MKDYYSILGVPRSSADHEIKRAYRSLVQQYHPDRNPDPKALLIIQEINEAYDILGDPKTRRAYDSQLDNPFTSYTPPEPPPHRDPAYRRKRSYTPPSTPKVNEQLEMMKKIVAYAKYINWTGCIVFAMILIDIVIPARVLTEKVVDFKTERSTRRSQREYIVTNTNRHIQVQFNEVENLSHGDDVFINQSKIFSVTRSIEVGSEKITNLSTIYRNFIFVPILLIIFSALGIAIKQSVEFRFNLLFVNTIALIFTLVLLLN